MIIDNPPHFDDKTKAILDENKNPYYTRKEAQQELSKLDNDDEEQGESISNNSAITAEDNVESYNYILYGIEHDSKKEQNISSSQNEKNTVSVPYKTLWAFESIEIKIP